MLQLLQFKLSATDLEGSDNDLGLPCTANTHK